MKLDDLLSDRNVPFQRLHHPPAYGANRIAQMLHVSGKEMAKPVLLRTERNYVMAVVPANERVDLDRVRQCLDEDWVEMAGEAEMTCVFCDCEVGVMPPFGSLYHVRTLVDDHLAEDGRIVFENQNHEEVIRMAYHDYEAIEHPIRGQFTCSPSPLAQEKIEGEIVSCTHAERGNPVPSARQLLRAFGKKGDCPPN